MNEPTAQQTPGKRAAAYWFLDGLPEIVFGVMYLGMGILGLAAGYMGNRYLNWAVAGAWLIFVVVFIWDRRIVGLLKARLTYPRTGYAKPPSEPKTIQDWEIQPLRNAEPPDENVTRFRIRTVFLFFVAMQMVQMTGTLGNGTPSRWSIPVVMALVAALEYWWNRDEPRSYGVWSVVPIAAAGLLTLGWDVPGRSRKFVPLVIGGAWLAWHGVWNLVRYLRANPRSGLEGAQV
jgi:hypothetical protein